jgi:tetratricopeptide (TPR) repeat protein
MTPINPYVAGNPVGDSDVFVGRADVLRESLRVLRRSQDNALLFFGQRRIGKTSILQHLVARLPQEGDYHPVFFDLQYKAEWPVSRVVTELAQTIAAHLDSAPPLDLGESPLDNFRHEWLPLVLATLPEGTVMVLLFDEFDVLADPQGESAARTFFPYLRELMDMDRARLKFIFVIGRNVSDLSTIALSLFKGTPHKRVSLLNREDINVLVRLSQSNGSLHWSDEAVERVWQLTNGHPFLTQMLCSQVWELLYEDDPDESPMVMADDVDTAVPTALDLSVNSLEWLWNGLGPAERVVAAALAEAGSSPITQGALEHLLQESGVRVVIRELQNAPQLLQEWDILEPADSVSNGYRFRVELLRRWLEEHKQLSQVQYELDRIQPVAESLFQAAFGYYRDGQLEQAIPLLRQATTLNPSHTQATLLLSEILLAQGLPDEALQLLEQLYALQPALARPRLVQALFHKLKLVPELEQLQIYAQILRVEPQNTEALSGQRGLGQKLGDLALQEGDLAAALEIYRQADLADQAVEVGQRIRHHKIEDAVAQIRTLEERRKYQEAFDVARSFADRFPDHSWQSELERLEKKAPLESWYQKGHRARRAGDRERAQAWYAKVVAIDPDYKNAVNYLNWALTGVDVLKQKQEARQEEKQYIEQPKVNERAIHSPNTATKHPYELKQSIWISRGLALFPLIISALALGIGTLPFSYEPTSRIAYLGIAAVLTLFWILSGSGYDGGVVTSVLGLLAGFLTTIGLASGVLVGIPSTSRRKSFTS